jgi:hypothetical protein
MIGHDEVTIAVSYVITHLSVYRPERPKLETTIKLNGHVRKHGNA